MRVILRYQLLFLSFVTNSRVVTNSIACGTPGSPFGGQVLSSSQNSFKTGDIVSYSCNETDYLLGSLNRTCGPDSKWSGSVPVCLNPSKVNAVWEITDYYDTGSDYLQNHDQSELLFDHNPGTCSEPDNYAALNIRINSTRLLKYVRVVFPLNINSKIQVHSKSLLDNKNCVELGSSELRNGTMYQVTFNCSFKADDGQAWLSLVFEESRLVSICEIFVFYGSDEGKCGTPDAPPNGQIQPISNLSDEAFNFYCDPGFDLSGYPNTTCSPDRLWIQETPLCVKSSLSESDIHFKTGRVDNMTFGSGPSTVSTTPADSSSREFHSHRYFFIEFNFNYLYVGFGSLALLIVLIVIIVLIARGVKRRNTLSLQNDTINSTRNSNLRLPSHCEGSFPFSHDAQMIQDIKMRQFEVKSKSVTANHYSVPVIPSANNQNISHVGDPPTYENVGTAETLYEVPY